MWMLAGLVIACVLILWIIIDIGMPMSYLTIPEPLQITITFFVQHLPQILFIVLLIFSILIVINYYKWDLNPIVSKKLVSAIEVEGFDGVGHNGAGNFLETIGFKSHKLRNKYYTKDLVLDYQTSHFNAKKIMGLCERCKKKKSTEVHHLQHQKDADKDGFIGEFHKNHMGNLISLCHDCHERLHKEIANCSKGHIRQKSGLDSTSILREV
jgi:hypothetical protein